MDNYGYFIVQALVTDICPDGTVKRAMNEINAAQRLRVAAADKAEAEKILKVKVLLVTMGYLDSILIRHQ